MVQKQEQEIEVKQGLWIDKIWLEKAGLNEKVKIIIQEKEIHILPVQSTTINNSKEKIAKAGLHLGAISMADDFDEPFPDSFWLGE